MLDDIERELKRKLERLSLPDLPGRKKSSQSESRHTPARHTTSHKTPRATPHTTRPAATPQPGGFDFSKPYEFKPSTEPSSTPAPSHPRPKLGRPTAALLGGLFSKKT